MQKIKFSLSSPFSNFPLFLGTTLIFILLIQVPPINAFDYPYKLIIVDQSKASYATPEETLSSNFSALLHQDLDWYYNTMTQATAEEDKQLFQEAGIDLKSNFDLVDKNDETFILENRPYKTGILLIAVSRRPDGFVMRSSVPFVQVNGQWKITSEFGYDPDLDQYDSLVLPSQIVTPFSVRFHPEELDLNWYHKIKGQQVEHAEVVCVLQGIKDGDGDGKVLPVSEITPTSLYLNDIVPHSPWSSSKNKPIDILIIAAPNDY
ncbi:MAG: hypothetical protein KKD63_06650, partial [Proteobacteria bacterium]|nr:hypothetical protein [Pseudomonadota bacterium]